MKTDGHTQSDWIAYNKDMNLQRRSTQQARVLQQDGTTILAIPASNEDHYHLAQLDDYLHQKRNNFNWQPPVTLSLEARITNSNHRGTWGFGFWNDPFSAALGIGGSRMRLPVLPNCAWFFHASPASYLSFRDDLPANGSLAGVFSSLRFPGLFSLLALPVVPLLLLPPSARFLRKLASKIIHEDATQVQVNALEWQKYSIEWIDKKVAFKINGQLIFQTSISPKGRAGLVIWVDNQYAAFTPSGKLSMGKLHNASSTELWLRNIEIK